MSTNRLKVSENNFRWRKTRNRCGRVQCQLHRGLKNRNAPGVAGLAIVAIGAVPVESSVNPEQAHRENEGNSQQPRDWSLQHDDSGRTPATMLARMPSERKASPMIFCAIKQYPSAIAKPARRRLRERLGDTAPGPRRSLYTVLKSNPRRSRSRRVSACRIQCPSIERPAASQDTQRGRSS